MATVTVKITSYSSLTLTYNVVATDTTSTITFTNWKFTNSRSSGTTKKLELTINAYSSTGWYNYDSRGSQANYVTSDDGLELASNVPVGTKSKTGTFSSFWLRYKKLHTARTISLSFYVTMYAAEDAWDKDIDVGFSISAKDSYTVTLDADGGTLGTSTLTKWLGEPLYLTSGFLAPVRDGYRFEGWASSSGGTVLSSYTSDEATTLYAVWTPLIENVSLDVSTLRVADGTATSESDDGTWCYGTCGYRVNGGAAGTLTLNVSVSPSGPTIQTDSFTVSKSADSTLTGTVMFRASGCLTENQYTFTVNASCTNESATQAAVTKSQGNVLSVAYYPMDILGDAYWDAENQTGERPGHGISFGAPCTREGFYVAMPFHATSMAGFIQMFGGSTAPTGWLLCDGSAVSRTDYAELFAVIGTTYGTGDGSTTFNLPNLQGRFPLGSSSSYSLAATGGSADAIVPYHNHAMGAHTHTNPGEQYLTNSETVARRTVASGSGATNQLYSSGATSRASNTGAMNGTPYTGYAGSSGNATGANMPPYVAVNYIICTGI